MKPITNAKIEKLTARYKDKSLSRAERQEILSELNWEKYRADPRPSMTLKKFKLLDAVVYLCDMVIFGMMLFETKHHGFNAFDFVMTAVVVVCIAAAGYYLYIHNKYKIEPADELSNRNMSRASGLAAYALIALLLAVSLVMFIVNENGVITIPYGKLMNVLCTALFGYSFAANLIFIGLEGKEETEEE